MQGIKEGKEKNLFDLGGIYPLSGPHAGLPWSGRNLGKTIISQGQRKVMEFCKRSGKILEFVRVREFYKHKEVENEEKNIDGLQKKLKQI